MIVFGWGGGTPKDRGAVAPASCPNCGNIDYFRLISSTKWFRLYFIPLIPYSIRHFLICPVCTSGLELKGSDLQRAQRMLEMTRLHAQDMMGESHYLEAVKNYWSDRSGAAPAGSLDTSSAASSQPILASATETQTSEAVRVLPGGRVYHGGSCRLVEGRSDAEVLDEPAAVRRGLRPCGSCGGVPIPSVS